MIEPKSWEQTMTSDEIRWIWSKFNKILKETDSDGYMIFYNADNFRAARIWKSSQRRRYFKQKDKGCCGFYDTVVERWNNDRNDFDKYLIGFNYGH